MGIVHYLGRATPDRALFCLGKFWYEPAVFFGAEIGQRPSYQLALAPHELVNEATLYLNIIATLHRDGGMPLAEREPYARELARRITRFAAGQPVEFHNDASSDMEDYRDDHGDGDLNIVDTAYSSDWRKEGA